MTRLQTALLTVIAVCLVLAGSVRAGSSVKPMIYGHGTQSCGTWEPNTPYAAWVLGFVTSANTWFAVFKDQSLAKTDGPGIQGWITKYCLEHPLDLIDAAATQLVIELRTRALKESDPVE